MQGSFNQCFSFQLLYLQLVYEYLFPQIIKKPFVIPSSCVYIDITELSITIQYVGENLTPAASSTQQLSTIEYQ